MLRLQRNTLPSSLAVCCAYALAGYVLLDKRGALPTFAFLAAVPLALGAIPLLMSDIDQIRSYVYILFIPWISLMMVFALLFALLKEGALCLLVIGAPLWGLAMLGTLIAVLVRAVLISRRKRQAVGIALMLLPFALVGFEQHHLVRQEQTCVTSRVVIAAPAREVFNRLAQVDTIRDEDYHPGFFN